MKTVHLTPAEIRLADYLATVRAQHHLETRPESITLFGSLDDYVANMKRSVGAEIAFCRMMNVFPCTEVIDSSNRDATMPDGRGVDVKSTANPRGPLIAKLKKNMHPTDLYAQVLTTRAEEGVYTLTGFISSKVAITPRFFVDDPKPYYRIPQTELWDWEAAARP